MIEVIVSSLREEHELSNIMTEMLQHAEICTYNGNPFFCYDEWAFRSRVRFVGEVFGVS